MTLSKPLSGKRIFIYFLLFFCAITAVNAVMIRVAVRTMSGVVTDHPYERGVAYNKVVLAEEAQERLGWHEDITYRDHMLHVALYDRDGTPLALQDATAKFTRPTRQGYDFERALKGSDTPVTFPLKGVWDVHVFAKANGQEFQRSKRLIVP